MKNDKIPIVAGLFWAVLTIFTKFFMYELEYNPDNLKIVCIILSVNLVLQMITLNICNIPIVSFFTVFIILLYIFHFGQVYCVAFNVNTEESVALLQYMSNRVALMKSLAVCLVCINSTFIGGLLYRGIFHKKLDYIKKPITNDSNVGANGLRFEVFAWIIFFISLPFRLYIDIGHIAAGYIGGYRAAYSAVSVSGVAGCFSEFWFISLPLVYISINNSVKKRLFFISVILYMALCMMLSGSRANQVVGSLGLLIVYFQYHKMKICFKNIVKILVIGLPAVCIISIIQKSRIYSGNYLISNFSDLVVDSINNNFLFSSLNEMGATLWTPYLVEVGNKSLHPYLGQTFINSLITIVPNVFRSAMYSNIQRKAVIGYILMDNLHVKGIGGSYIAEMYYDFQNFYWVGGLIFGYFYNNISMKSKEALENHNYMQLSRYLPLMILSIFWVRDTFCGLLRGVVWFSLLYFLFTHIEKHKKIRRL